MFVNIPTQYTRHWAFYCSNFSIYHTACLYAYNAQFICLLLKVLHALLAFFFHTQSKTALKASLQKIDINLSST